ncbi:MAG: prephenate dehydratase, partial [Gemmatimonadetes bacterium]|nr:prephenate dehydratase [Gemmatimonadota bacterium]
MVLQRERDGAEAARVAFQGELGAYSEDAVRLFFGAEAVPVPQREFRDVGRAVAAGDGDYGALPIENTLAGGVGGSYDVLAVEELEVVGEGVVPIHHCVLGVAGSQLGGLRRVLSHPVALVQCARFFEAHPGIEAVAVYDTAGAAREVARLAEPATAALASRGAAERYRLALLATDVEDRPDNQTRFLVVGRRGAPRPRAPWRTNGRRTAVILETANQPGSLARALLAFAERGINLSKLESRPTGEPWTYRFFLEIDADAATPDAHFALEEVRRRSKSVRVLGSYASVAATPPISGRSI